MQNRISRMGMQGSASMRNNFVNGLVGGENEAQVLLAVEDSNLGDPNPIFIFSIRIQSFIHILYPLKKQPSILCFLSILINIWRICITGFGSELIQISGPISGLKSPNLCQFRAFNKKLARNWRHSSCSLSGRQIKQNPVMLQYKERDWRKLADFTFILQ